jgi:hypothetical protein
MEIQVKLRLERQYCGATETIGQLYIDDEFECWTLEDVQRESGVKVPGDTCIPPGNYQIAITESARFGRELPLLMDVPMFSGIRIHPGNTAADTEGCILVGSTRNEHSIGESRKAFDKLFIKLMRACAAGDPIEIEVVA